MNSGNHPDHPLVKEGKVQSKPGWDGEYGPFFEKLRDKEYVNSASLDRSDYVIPTARELDSLGIPNQPQM
jgi:hypothetical protein